MYVCICRAVTEREILSAIELGAVSMQALRSRLGVSSECGLCAGEVRRILKEHKRDHCQRARRRA